MPSRPEFSLETLSAREARFWHARWHENRRRVWEAFGRIRMNGNRCERFRCCGSALWLESCSDELRLKANFCGDRWCQACQSRLIGNVRNQLFRALDGREVRMVTLTIRHNVTPLFDQIRRLRAHFQELRRRHVWRSAVDGSAAFIEVKIGRDELWHPHAHVLCVGRWIDAHILGKEWHKITGDSFIVDISAAPTFEEAMCYATKYVTKPVHQGVYAVPNRLDEAILAMKGVRAMSTAGTLKSIKLRAKPPKDRTKKWTGHGRPDAIFNSHDPSNVSLTEAAIRKWPRLSIFIRSKESHESETF